MSTLSSVSSGGWSTISLPLIKISNGSLFLIRRLQNSPTFWSLEKSTSSTWMFDSKKEFFRISSEISGSEVATSSSASLDESSLMSSRPMMVDGPISSTLRCFKLFREFKYLRPTQYQLKIKQNKIFSKLICKPNPRTTFTELNTKIRWEPMLLIVFWT